MEYPQAELRSFVQAMSSSTPMSVTIIENPYGPQSRYLRLGSLLKSVGNLRSLGSTRLPPGHNITSTGTKTNPLALMPDNRHR